MQITSALNNALYGIKKGLSEMDKTAAQIASRSAFHSQNPVDFAQPLVELQGSRIQVELSAMAMKSVDETIGSLLDAAA